MWAKSSIRPEVDYKLEKIKFRESHESEMLSQLGQYEPKMFLNWKKKLKTGKIWHLKKCFLITLENHKAPGLP